MTVFEFASNNPGIAITAIVGLVIAFCYLCDTVIRLNLGYPDHCHACAELEAKEEE